MAGRSGGCPAIGALRLAGAAWALSLALAAMGCGGDESSDDEPAPAPATAADEARPPTDPSDEGSADRREDEPAPRRGNRRSESSDGGARKPDRTRHERAGPGRSDRSERRPRRRRRGGRVTPGNDRSRFITAADAACADYREREARARGENDGQKSSQLRYLDTTAALIRELLDRLRSAPTPDADRIAMAGYIAAIEEVEVEVRRFRDALDREDPRSGEHARRVADTSAEARRLAREIGFRVCGAE